MNRLESVWWLPGECGVSFERNALVLEPLIFLGTLKCHVFTLLQPLTGALPPPNIFLLTCFHRLLLPENFSRARGGGRVIKRRPVVVGGARVVLSDRLSKAALFGWMLQLHVEVSWSVTDLSVTPDFFFFFFFF